MKRLKYQVLRRITGAYNTSNQLTLAGIAAVEPLERKLDDISVSWFAGSIKNADPNIPDFLHSSPAPLYHRWEDGKDLYS